MFHRNIDTFKRQGESWYYDKVHLNNTINSDKFEELWSVTNQINNHMTLMKNFVKNHYKKCIVGEDSLFDNESHVKISEYAP